MSLPPATFELRVQFAGLCMYVRDPKQQTLTVLMPDARATGEPLVHEDGSEAVPHVGYLRFDLANVETGVAGALSEGIDSPTYEVVHRFEGAEISFDLGGEVGSYGAQAESEPVNGEPAVPDFDDFAPNLELIPDVLADRPPEVVLMRTVLRGGTVEPILEDERWTLSRELAVGTATKQRTPAEQHHQFGGVAEWTRTVQGNGLTIRITRFSDGKVVTIPLRPITLPGDTPAITLKIANLCAENPLEWEELPMRTVAREDADFRWLYKLLRSRRTAAGVRYPPAVLPAPQLVHAGAGLGGMESRTEGAAQNCFGGKITHSE
jgi:hypothetical protein